MAPRAEPTAVVGWGSLNPLAADADSTWKAVIAGHSGIQTLQEPWTEDLPVRLAGCVPTGALDSLPPLLRRRSDRCAQLALVAAQQAWAMAGNLTKGLDPSRIAVVIGIIEHLIPSLSLLHSS